MIFIFIIIFFYLSIITPVKAITSVPIDISEKNIYQIQDAIDQGYFDYEQLIKIYLERIETYNKNYNAIITLNSNVIKEARALNEEYKKNGRRSLIHGLPILIKDNIDVVGMPTTAGIKILLDSYPKKNAYVVQKLIDNGAIIIGKANMSTLALDGISSYSSFGHTKNAYNLSYSSYGSTGGGAVGVAVGFAVAAIGTDTGISLRLPAAANNLVGFRPSFNRINMNGIMHLDSTRDTVGPITRYVEDSAIIMDILDEKYDSYSDSLTKNSLDNIKIGILKSSLDRTDSKITKLFKQTVIELENLGAKIKYIDSLNLKYDFSNIQMCYDFNQYIIGTTSKVKSFSSLAYNTNTDISEYINQYCTNGYLYSNEYKKYIETKNKNIDIANNVFKNNDIDVIIYPTIENKLVKISQLGSYYVKTDSSRTANLIGFPSLNIQIGFSENLPYGMEIMSKSGNENTIYNIAYNLQKERNYYKLPSISPVLYKVSKEQKEGIRFKRFIDNVFSKISPSINKFIKTLKKIF